jgi:hypothetical protein
VVDPEGAKCGTATAARALVKDLLPVLEVVLLEVLGGGKLAEQLTP